MGLGLLVLIVVPALAEEAELDASLVEPELREESGASGGRTSRVLEEILVTAQKKEESLHDVPISMTVVDDEFLNQESVTDLAELSQHVPNVRVMPATFAPQVNMRGFGIEAANKGLDSPVGLVIDGVSYGNQTYLQTGFFDVSRIEVLRGPQNTLFGKNNSVGLFNMVTNDPTEELSGALDVEIGDPRRRRFEGAVGGPLLPGAVSFRIALLSDEREGFQDNTTASVEPSAHSRMIGIDRKAVRVKAELPDLLGADVVLSYERFQIDVSGTGFELAIVPEGTRSLFREFDPNADFEFGNYVVSQDYPSLTRNDIDNVIANVSYGLAGWALDAVAGYSVLEVDNDLDADLTPAPAIFGFTKDTNRQTTLELRAASPELRGLFGVERLFGRALGGTELTTGLFYQRREVTDSEFTAAFDTALLAAFAVLGGGPPPPGTPAPPTPITRETVGQNFEETTLFWGQTSDTIAGYGQASWQFAERWMLIGGLRVGNEWKSADWERVFAGDAPAFLSASAFEEFTASLERSELQYAPRVNLRYDLTDEFNVFATWARGFRGGGFNEFATSNAKLEFEPETTENWEVGTNMELLDGVARANVVLFRTTITEFQLLTNDPETGFNEVKNAGKARAQGVEADALWLPTDWLLVRAALGLNDSEFVEFPFGACNVGGEDSDGDGDPRCDLSGETLHRTPKWVATLTPAVRAPLGELLAGVPFVAGGLELIGSFTVEYRDTQLLDATLDPRTRQGSFFRFDGNVGIENPAVGWSLRVTVPNLTDQLVTESSLQAPLLGGHFIRSPESPRHVFGEFRWRF